MWRSASRSTCRWRRSSRSTRVRRTRPSGIAVPTVSMVRARPSPWRGVSAWVHQRPLACTPWVNTIRAGSWPGCRALTGSPRRASCSRPRRRAAAALAATIRSASGSITSMASAPTSKTGPNSAFGSAALTGITRSRGCATKSHVTRYFVILLYCPNILKKLHYPCCSNLARPLRIPSRSAFREAPMALFDNPFDAKRRLARGGCSCGAHASQAAHDAAQDATPTGEAALERAVEGAVMRALFPHDAERRAFLRSVGAATALAAVSQFLPTKLVAEAFAQGESPRRPTSRSASSRSPAPRRSSWPSPWASTRSRA